MEEYADPQEIIDRIDQEGWPDALQWLVTTRFSPELDQIIYEALLAYNSLAHYEEELLGAAEEAGADNYLG